MGFIILHLRRHTRLHPCIRTACAIGLVAILGYLWLGCTPAQAHKVSVFAWVESGKIHVESKFSGGRRPQRTPVQVFDMQGRKLLEGTTDANGTFVFDVPAVTDLKIVLLAGMGHQAEWIVRRHEIEPPAGHATKPNDPENKNTISSSDISPQTGKNESAVDDAQESAENSAVSAAELETIVERVVEKKLAPIRKMLAEHRDTGPSVTDIIGGFGI